MEIGIGDIKRELASSLLKLKHAKRDGNAQRTNVLMSKIEACFGELEKYKLLSINDIDFLAESKRKYNLFLKEQVDTARSEQSDAGDILVEAKESPERWSLAEHIRARIKEIGIPSFPSTEQPGSGDGNKPYVINMDRVGIVYNFCIETGVFSGDFSNVCFLNSVAKADFNYLYSDGRTIKSKLKKIIWLSSYCVEGDGWYKQAAESIGTTPSGCSGANVQEEGWKRNFDKIKTNFTR